MHEIEHVKGWPYNPKCQGAVDAFNKTIQQKINSYRNDCLSSGINFKLDKSIKELLNYYNNMQKHSTAQCIPNKLFFSDDLDEINIKAQVNVEKMIKKKKFFR